MKHMHAALALLFLNFTGTGQTKYSLKEAIDYATANSYTVKSLEIDHRLATAQKGEQTAKALPQINGNVDYLHYQQIQKNILENGVGLVNRTDIPKGTVIPTQLGLPNQLIPTVTGSQVIFDQSYFTSIHAAKVYQDLSEKNVTRSKIDVAVAVTRAYYAVLVNQEQLKYLDANLARLDSSYAQAKAQYAEGIIRIIDLDRIEVSYNNLKEERNRISRMVDLSQSLLRFQMSISDRSTLVLTDSLSESLLQDVSVTAVEKVSYANRVEYSILETQTLLRKMDTRNAQASRYPRLSAIGLIGYNPGASQFANLSQSNRWIQYSYLGLRLQVPIFNGLLAKYKVQQKHLEEDRIKLYRGQLERSIDLEVDQALNNLQNSMESLKTQRRNLQLAEKNLKLFKAESTEGLVTNLEVTVAEADLKQAQTNYYNALYNALVSKTEYQKAMGTLQ